MQGFTLEFSAATSQSGRNLPRIDTGIGRWFKRILVRLGGVVA